MKRERMRGTLAGKLRSVWLPLICAIALILLAVLVLLYLQRPVLPPSIASKVSFVVDYPSSDWKIDYESIKFQNDASKVLSFTAQRDGTLLNITEQPSPDPFQDIPNYIDKVTVQMGEFRTFDSAAGTVHLTRPKAANGNEVAVANTQGTLMFIRANEDLPDDAWRRLFNSLVKVK
jgi:hypothetical protein